MVNLIKNEWMKIFKRPGTFVMIGMLIVAITLVGIVVKSQQNDKKFVQIKIGSKYYKRKITH